MKMTVTVELETPPGVLLYDIGSESFICKGCGNKEVYAFIQERHSRRRPAAVSIPAAFKDWAANHNRCINDSAETHSPIP